jgi:hypothetical protein
MANNNNSCASALEKATQLPTSSSGFGSPSVFNTPLYTVGPKSSSECMGGKGKPSVSVSGLVAPAPTTVIDLSGYGGSIAPAPLPTTVSTSGYGGFIGSDSGVGKQCVHFNQGIGNGAEGGDPGKSAPRGGSNDEGGRTPGQRPVRR